METKKIVLFNGPAGSGKDEAASFCAEHFGGRQMEFKERLFQIALTVCNMPEEDWWEIYDNRWNENMPNKETPLVDLGSLSQREFLIKISEEWVKPVFGKDYFGQCAVADVTSYSDSRFFFSDSGFVDEALPLIKRFGADNVAVVKLHRDGCTFEGDSRNYLPTGIVPINNHYEVFNHGQGLEAFKEGVRLVVKNFILS